MRARRVLLVATEIAAIIASTQAIAGPLDPPTHKFKVALFERTAKKPTRLNLTMAVTPSQDRGAMVIATARPGRTRRLLRNGEGSWYIEARRGGTYPSVA